MLRESVIREKVERYDAKLRCQSGNRVRYTIEVTVDYRDEVIVAHIDMDAAKAYIAEGNGWRKLMPFCHMTAGQKLRAEVARHKLWRSLDIKHVRNGVVIGSLKVVA